MPDYYIGLMSGTSVDGVDAAVVDFSASTPALIAADTFPWPDALHADILRLLRAPDSVCLDELGRLDAQLGESFADAALKIVDAAGLQAAQINAIGSHGQTLYHAPDAAAPFSLQAGDANRIAERTGITTVADFRRRDIAAGGQGAPLVPAFHEALFRQPGTHRAIVNIGGIANVTHLPGDNAAATGFDTGPGNGLMDAWTGKHRQQAFDRNGDWARGGQPSQALLSRLLETPYFSKPPPKSTGRELFNLRWLEGLLAGDFEGLGTDSVQATLCELTARAISEALLQYCQPLDEVYICGGGVHNGLLMQRLSELLGAYPVRSTETLGLHPDWVEASAFAWLARQTLSGLPGNLPGVTGAAHAVILGAIHPGRR